MKIFLQCNLRGLDMERDFFGLKVDCKASELDDYIKMRSLIEQAMRKVTAMLSVKGKCNMESNFVKVPGHNPYYLTFCIANEKIYFGLYDKDKKTVTDSCNYGDIRALGQSEFNRLYNIMENYVKNNIKMPNLNALDLAWKEEMLRRKAKEMGIPQKENSSKAKIEEFAAQNFINKAPPKKNLQIASGYER